MAQAALNPFWTEDEPEASQSSGPLDLAGSSKNKKSSSQAGKKRSYKKKEKIPAAPATLPSSGSESDEASQATKRKTKIIPDSEDEVVYKEPVRAAPLRSFLNQRAASGFTSQSDPARRGDYYFELRIYNTREIERIANSERWKNSIVTLKLTTDLDTSMWKALTRVVQAGKEEFKGIQPILYPNNPF